MEHNLGRRSRRGWPALLLAISCCISAAQAHPGPSSERAAIIRVTDQTPLPSIHGLHIGDAASSLSPLGLPDATEKYDSYDVAKWNLAGGAELSVSSRDGKIAYLEHDWGRDPSSTRCDFPGMVFGKTTLREIRARMGSNGVTYADRGVGAPTADGGVLFNSYEIGDVVVTFVTHVSAAEYQKAGSSPDAVGDLARLDALILSSKSYVTAWGQRILSPGYRPIDWR